MAWTKSKKKYRISLGMLGNEALYSESEIWGMLRDTTSNADALY